MFETLSARRLVRLGGGPLDATIPAGLPAVAMGSRMLDHLNRAEIEDYAVSGFPKDAPFRKGADSQAHRALVARFLCRISAYVITVCSLDGILVRSWADFLKQLTDMGFDLKAEAGRKSTSESERKMEIKDFRYVRNKVLAHTSFASPRDDSKSLQFTSVEYFAGNFLTFREDHLALGGGAFVIDKHDMLPKISIVGHHDAVRVHYERWEAMFLDLMDRLPPEELTRKTKPGPLL